MSLCASFRDEAGRVWRQMLESSQLGLGLSEETLTETALYGIARKHQSGEIVISPATKPQEAKHGGDWEWWFIKNGKAIGFRVQAKRLFPNGRYQSLYKPGDKFGQLKKLTAAAAVDGLFPLYCFYNFEHGPNTFAGHINACAHTYRGPSFWGCSLALPADVEFANSDLVGNLISAAVPWHALVCDAAGSDLPSAALSFIRRLSAPRVFSPQLRSRPGLEVTAELRDVPEYVQRLALAGVRSRGDEHAERYLDHEYWDDPSLAEKPIAGIVAFEDRRD